MGQRGRTNSHGHGAAYPILGMEWPRRVCSSRYQRQYCRKGRGTVMRPDEFTPVWPGQAAQAPVARPEAVVVRQFDLMVIAVFLGSAVGAVLGVVLAR